LLVTLISISTVVPLLPNCTPGEDLVILFNFFQAQMTGSDDFPSLTRIKIHVIIRVHFHEDQDANRYYIGDPYLKGIISYIPTIWGLPPATVKQPLNEYDPEILFNQEEEFLPFKLDARIEDKELTIYCPVEKKRRVVGRKVLLEPDIIEGRSY